MPAHFSLQSGSRKSTCERAKLICRSVSAVAVAVSIIVGLDVSFASGRSGNDLSESASQQAVNRTQKGNRLPAASALQIDRREKTQCRSHLASRRPRI